MELTKSKEQIQTKKDGTNETSFDVFSQYEDQLKRCIMLPEDINTYINASCSMIGAMEYLMIDVREQLKGLKLWKQEVKYYGKLTLEVIDGVVNFADKSTDDRAFDMHISDIEVFRRVYVRDGMNLSTSVQLIHEVARLAVELCESVMAALSHIELRSPIANHIHGMASKLCGFSDELTVLLVKKANQPLIWPSMRSDIRNILYEVLDRRV